MSNFETTLDFAFVRYENTTRDQTPLERLLSSSMSKLIRCTKLPKRIAHFHKSQQILIITLLHYFFVTFVLIELELLLPIDAQPSAAFTFYKGQWAGLKHVLCNNKVVRGKVGYLSDCYFNVYHFMSSTYILFCPNFTLRLSQISESWNSGDNWIKIYQVRLRSRPSWFRN